MVSIISVSPNSGTNDVNNVVTVIGTGFDQFTGFTVSGGAFGIYAVPVTAQTYISATEFRVTLPKPPYNQTGFANLNVDDGGGGGDTKVNAFEFKLSGSGSTQTPGQAFLNPKVASLEPSSIPWQSSPSAYQNVKINIQNKPVGVNVSAYSIINGQRQNWSVVTQDTISMTVSVSTYLLSSSQITSNQTINILLEYTYNNVPYNNVGESDNKVLTVTPSGSIASGSSMIITGTSPSSGTPIVKGQNTTITVIGQNFPANIGSIPITQKGYVSIILGQYVYNIAPKPIIANNSSTNFVIQIPSDIQGTNGSLSLQILYYPETNATPLVVNYSYPFSTAGGTGGTGGTAGTGGVGGAVQSAPFNGFRFDPVPSQGTEFILEVATNNNTKPTVIRSVSDISLQRKSNATPAKLNVKVSIDTLSGNNSDYRFSVAQKIWLYHYDLNVLATYGTGGSDGSPLDQGTNSSKYPSPSATSTSSGVLQREKKKEKWFYGFITSARLRSGINGRYWEIEAEDNLTVLQNNRAGQPGKWRTATKYSGIDTRFPSSFAGKVSVDNTFIPNYTKFVTAPKGKGSGGSDAFYGAATRKFIDKNNKTSPAEYARWMIADLALNIVDPNKNGLKDVIFAPYGEIPNSKPTQYDFSKNKNTNILDSIRKIMKTDPFLFDSGLSPDEVNFDDISRNPHRVRSGSGGEFQMTYDLSMDQDGVAEYFRRGGRKSGLALYQSGYSSLSYITENPRTHTIIDHNLSRNSSPINKITIMSRDNAVIGSYSINYPTASQYSQVDASPGHINERTITLNIDFNKQLVNSSNSSTGKRGVSVSKIKEIVMPLVDAMKLADSPDSLSVTISGDPRILLPDGTRRLPMAGEALFVNIPTFNDFREWYVIDSWNYSYPDNRTSFNLGKPASLGISEIQESVEKNLSDLFNRPATEDSGWIPIDQFKNNSYVLPVPGATSYYTSTVYACYQDGTVSSNVNPQQLQSTSAESANTFIQEVSQLSSSVETGVAWSQVSKFPSLGKNVYRDTSINDSLPSVKGATVNYVDAYSVSFEESYNPEFYGTLPSEDTIVTVPEVKTVAGQQTNSGYGFQMDYIYVEGVEDGNMMLPISGVKITFPTGYVALDKSGKLMETLKGNILIRIVAEAKN